jgi:hypothetical protein
MAAGGSRALEGCISGATVGQATLGNAGNDDYHARERDEMSSAAVVAERGLQFHVCCLLAGAPKHHTSLVEGVIGEIASRTSTEHDEAREH